LRDGGVEHLADADLADTLFCRVSREPEEAETGDKDGKAGKECRKATDEGFQLEFLRISFVREIIQKGKGGVISLEDGLQFSRRIGCRIPCPLALIGLCGGVPQKLFVF
jgi:hypothetical protein